MNRISPAGSLDEYKTSTYPGGASALDDAVANGVADQIADGVEIQLGHDVRPVRLHGFDADIQCVGHFFVGFSLGDQLNDLALAWTDQARRRSSVTSGGAIQVSSQQHFRDI